MLPPDGNTRKRNTVTFISIPCYGATEAGLKRGNLVRVTEIETNWIQTVDGRDFLVALRLYGTGVEFYDHTWKPDDVVKVK